MYFLAQFQHGGTAAATRCEVGGVLAGFGYFVVHFFGGEVLLLAARFFNVHSWLESGTLNTASWAGPAIGVWGHHREQSGSVPTAGAGQKRREAPAGPTSIKCAMLGLFFRPDPTVIPHGDGPHLCAALVAAISECTSNIFYFFQDEILTHV